jgi:hypothetical protein
MGHHNNVPDDYPMHEVHIEQTCFICPEVSSYAVCRSLLQDCVRRGLSVCLNTEECSASSGTDTTDHHEVL